MNKVPVTGICLAQKLSSRIQFNNRFLTLTTTDIDGDAFCRDNYARYYTKSTRAILVICLKP